MPYALDVSNALMKMIDRAENVECPIASICLF
jgi:hypothetical protein